MSFKLLEIGRNAHRRVRIGRVVLAAAAICVATVPLPSFAAEITVANLVHRWSFNGNFDDTGSGAHQTAEILPSGSTLVTAGSTALEVAGSSANRHTGYLKLGTNLLPTDSDGVTIEIFATPKDAMYQWARIFAYGTSSSKLDFTWAVNSNVNKDMAALPDGTVNHDTMQPYTLNEMHHISVVLEKDGNGGTWIRWARRDTATGEIESKYNFATTFNNPGGYNENKTNNNEGMRRINNWTVASFGNNAEFLLGGAFSGTADIKADYHEVRIWNVALSDGQLSANAKAGPDTPLAACSSTPDSWAEYITTEDQKCRFLDTGITGRSGTKVEAKFRQTATTSTWPVFIGVDGSDNETRFHPIAFYYQHQLHFQYRGVFRTEMIYNPGGFNADLVVTSDYKADGTATVVVTDTGGNELANVTSSDLGAALDTGRNMYLFACNGNTWLSDYFFGRCYYVKIWQTDGSGGYQLVRDYVPCVKDGVAGLYDNVSNTIFYPTGLPVGYVEAGTAATATWNGSDANVSTPANWLCYDNTSALMANAVPSSGTAVTVDSSDPAPSVASTVAWNTLALGSVSGANGAISFTGGTATLNGISAGVGGSGSVTLNGDAAIIANGDTYLGQNGGANGTLSVGDAATATFNNLLVGLRGTGGVTVGGDAAVTISGVSDLGRYSGGHGEITQTGGTVTTGNNSDGFNVGRDGTGTYNLSGGTLNMRQFLRVGWGGGSSGNTFNMTGGTLNLAGQKLIVGDWSKNSEFNITAGTVSGDEQWYIGGYSSSNSGGSTGTGTFTQDGGDITLNNTINIGNYRGTGAYVMNGGTLKEKWWIQLGKVSTGTFTQNGGTITLSGGLNNGKPHCWVCLASGDNGNGTYTMNDGTLDVASGITFGEGSNGGTGRFEMNGGTVIVSTIKYVKGTATTVLNGGTLRAKASNATFLDNLGEVTVGGITIDTTEEGYELGVSSGTTLTVTPDATKPAITLAGVGQLDLSGVTVDLSSKPSANVYVLANVADGATGTFSGEPSVTMPGLRVRKSADSKSICLVRPGFTIIVH